MTHQSLKELKEAIVLLMEYAVDPEFRDAAYALLTNMQTDRVALNLLHEFYSYLPEANNDAITKLHLLDERQGTFLLLATSIADKYIYLANLERAVFLGPISEGIWDEEVLQFFGLERQKALEKFGAAESFQEYIPLGQSKDHCTVCSARVGELHQLGCPIEICPWCHGQLSHCNCRYDHTGKEQFKDTKQVSAFEEILKKKGRIPFDPEQKLGGLRE